jgi:L-asparagine transporter-like permease
MAIRSEDRAVRAPAAPPRPRSPGGARSEGFARALDAPALTLLTIGAMMGSGLFVASGLAIRAAGPAALLLYVVAFGAMALEIQALGEMAAADPVPGGFLVYARRVFGPGFTFVTGWIYWLSSVLTMSSEVTAAALLTRHWLPAVPLWLWSALYSAGIVAVNFAGVRGFGQVEGGMALVKVVAVAAFVLIGLAFLGGLLPTPPPPAPWSHFAGPGGPLPRGPAGAAPALVLALFAYAGTGVVAMAAAETRLPARDIPRAVRGTLALVAALYLPALAVLLLIVPWDQMPVTSSPFVAALRRTGLPLAADAMNLVLLTAVLSTMNAALYANVRVLHGLARQGEAPAALGRLDRRGLPAAATWVSAAALGATILLAYLLPHTAYAYLVSATGFQAMGIWIAVLLTHLRYRPYLLRHRPQALGFRLWGYPHTTRLALAVVASALAGALAVPAERTGSVLGALGIGLAAAAWLVLRRIRPPAGPPAGDR